MSRIFGLSQWKAMGRYWLCFSAAIIYWELLVKIVTGGLTGTGGYYFLCFVPAEALFLCCLEGWLPDGFNRFFMPVILMIMACYYAIQVGYYRIFGSFFSVSMLEMGTDAVADFGWTTKYILIASIGIFVLIFLPVLLSAIVELAGWIPKERYSVAVHVSAVFLTAELWLLGIGVLMLGGTSRHSAYYAFSNSWMDADTTSQKVGVSVMSLLETGSYMLGIGDTGEYDLAANLPVSVSSGNPEAVIGEADLQPQETESQQFSGEPEPDTEPKEHVFEEINFVTLGSRTEDDVIRNLCDYYAGTKGTKENEYTGRFEGYNLIYICAESFWSYAVDEEVTPTLYKLAHNGIVLDNYYNSFKNTTTNGEFALATSLWPDVSRMASNGTSVGSFPQSASKLMPYGLGNMTKEMGYQAYGYHNYKGYYYDRDMTLPNLGLQCKFMDTGMNFTSTWPASDLEMMQQSVDDYIDDDKFVAYYMTFSGHGPYDRRANVIAAKNWDEAVARTEGRGYSEDAIAYLACQIELDNALHYLIMRLKKAGKLKNTLIVLAGDHYPYYLSDEAVKSLVGYRPDPNFEIYQSTCIMYNSGIKTPIHNKNYCCNVDILPTVFNLLNVPYDSRMIAGTDVFADGFHKAVLYNKSYITRSVKYDAANGKVEWLIDVSGYSEQELQDYLDAVAMRVESEYVASLNMISCDFYQFVWVNSGLMSPEE